jgi:ankyrin repeat protein
MNKITNFLCLSLLLLGATVLGMHKSDEKLGRKLLKAAMSGNFEEVERLIAQGASVEAKDIDGATPLSWAAGQGYEDVCKLLIGSKASIESKSNRGSTPLICAAAMGLDAVCRLLIIKKASIDVKDNEGCTALSWAASRGGDAVCNLLIDVRLGEVRENKAAIATFLGIMRKRRENLPCLMQYDVAKMIAHQALQLAKWPLIEQLNEIGNSEIRAKWLVCVNQQMNSVNK